MDCRQRVRTEGLKCLHLQIHILSVESHVISQANFNMMLCPVRMQKVREQESNLYFNAKSSWRWCDFSAHPRVMLYADRTGVELTDIRVRQEAVGNMVVVYVFFSFSLDRN